MFTVEIHGEKVKLSVNCCVNNGSGCIFPQLDTGLKKLRGLMLKHRRKPLLLSEASLCSLSHGSFYLSSLPTRHRVFTESIIFNFNLP